MQITGDLLDPGRGRRSALFAMALRTFGCVCGRAARWLQFHRAQLEEARARRAEITEKLKPWFPVLLPDWEVR